jgi:hypothetical protein
LRTYAFNLINSLSVQLPGNIYRENSIFNVMTIIKTGLKINIFPVVLGLKIPAVWILLAPVLVSGLISSCSGATGKQTALGEANATLHTVEEEIVADKTGVSTTEIISSELNSGGNASVKDYSFGYTYHRQDGNRYVSGRGSLPEAMVLDIPLGGRPEWLVAAPDRETSVWVVALEDGRIQAFAVLETGYRKIEVTPNSIQPGQPPALIIEEGEPTILTAPGTRASPYSHPVMVDPQSGKLAFIETNGDLVFWEGGKETARLEVNALPDGRLIMDGNGNIVLLSDPTGRYDHGVLGDELEAESVTLVTIDPAPHILKKISAGESAVFEGIAPIWVDFKGDGEREIILTQSDRKIGARLVVYNRSGEQLATGPAIGLGYRWRNQLGAAPTGIEGELEVVDVRTPHLTGVVEFFRWERDRLVLSGEIEGYTSHVIGSRNLDLGMLGDFDGEGNIEALLPNQERSELGAVRRSPEGAWVVWKVPVGGVVSTNLAAATLEEGGIVVGVGRQDGVLRIWKAPGEN